MLDRAEIVIIGGGIIGCSIAYHLTRMGKTDVLLLEKSGLTHGATWHAAGLVGQLRSSRNLTRMLQRSVALYDRLEAETGQATDWRKVGSLRLASSPDRLLEIKRAATMAKSFGLEMSIVSAKEAQDLCPILNVEDVLAAAYLPSDGYVDPASVTQALAKGARMRGARMRQGIRVAGFERKGQRVTQLQTDQGAIECNIVVNAAGMWARELGLMMGVRVPSIAVEHQYLITAPIPDLPKAMADAILRYLSVRQDENWFVHGVFLRPHPPIIAPEPYNAMYDPASVPLPRRAATPNAEAAQHPYLAYALKALAEIGKYNEHYPHSLLEIDDTELRQLRATYYGMGSSFATSGIP